MRWTKPSGWIRLSNNYEIPAKGLVWAALKHAPTLAVGFIKCLVYGLRLDMRIMMYDYDGGHVIAERTSHILRGIKGSAGLAVLNIRCNVSDF